MTKLRLLSVAFLMLCLLPACKDDDGPGGTGLDASVMDATPLPDGLAPTTAQEVLAAAGVCNLGLARQFATEAGALKVALDAWAGAPLDAPTRVNAQQAWRNAMATWQQLEAFQFGPAATQNVIGGQDLRVTIYSWPTVDRCKVESALARDLYGNPAVLASNLSLRGLDALETLLFLTDTANACPPTDALVQAPWALLDAAALDQKRAAYAQVLGNDLLTSSLALQTAWEPTGGNFLAKVQTPSAPPYNSLKMALNALSDALFYVESETKDMKLGPALGITECSGCTSLYESNFALASKSNVINNLLGFQRLYSGCALDGAGPGFHQLLWTRGAGALAEEMNQALKASQQALATLQSPDLATAIVNERALVLEAHTQLTTLARLMKAQFVSVLDLNLPMSVATDND
ncbi:MAG: imelysin family protein [Myxococcales bacterium]|nr:imelysin family protein [Myxococcales bacterium]